MGRVILEIGGPNLRPETAHAGALSSPSSPPPPSRAPSRTQLTLARRTPHAPSLAVMKLAAAKLPCTTEVVNRSSQARVGFADVDKEPLAPRVVTLGEVQQAAAAEQAAELAAARAPSGGAEPSPL